MSDLLSYNDSKKVGAGTWYSLHLITHNLQSVEDVQAALKFIMLIKQKFGCMKCRLHFSEFISKDNPEIAARRDILSFRTTGRSGGHLAEWVYRAQNNVNSFSGKSMVDFSKVKEFFGVKSEKFVCTKECDANSNTQEVNDLKTDPLDAGVVSSKRLRFRPVPKF